MKPTCLVSIAFACLGSLLLAQPLSETASRAHLQEYVSTIQSELEGHGERVLGQETYHWSTRLQDVRDCRAELSVRVTSNLGELVVRTDRVKFSLGALEAYGIESKKNWLILPCAAHAKCILSTSTCSKRSKEGIVTDCSGSSQKSAESFNLQLDGNPGASSRLEDAFRQAIKTCREPASVTF